MNQILTISFLVFAIWYTMLEGEIFGWLSNGLKKVTPQVIHDPLFDCAVCMCFWYGSAIYWLIYRNTWQDWLITVTAAMGLNVIITRLWPDK